jgi:16S rRNA G966 N2-methylase RsmD
MSTRRRRVVRFDHADFEACVPQTDEILLGDNLDLLPQFADGAFRLIYIDPPFNPHAPCDRAHLAPPRVSEAQPSR